MTTVLDTFSTTMERLIQSCQRSERGFKAAAEAARNEQLKRLLNIYSHQRIRFAGELKSQWTQDDSAFVSESDHVDPFTGKTDEEILESCLKTDANCLDAYCEALAARFPGKARFLIAAQYSLLQQVHERMRALASSRDQARITSVSHTYET